MKTKKRFTLLLSIGAAALLIGVVAGIAPASKLAAQGDAPEKIIIGNAIALSGPNAQGAMLSQIPSYDLWAADVNAAGGITLRNMTPESPLKFSAMTIRVTLELPSS